MNGKNTGLVGLLKGRDCWRRWRKIFSLRKKRWVSMMRRRVSVTSRGVERIRRSCSYRVWKAQDHEHENGAELQQNDKPYQLKKYFYLIVTEMFIVQPLHILGRVRVQFNQYLSWLGRNGMQRPLPFEMPYIDLRTRAVQVHTKWKCWVTNKNYYEDSHSFLCFLLYFLFL